MRSELFSASIYFRGIMGLGHYIHWCTKAFLRKWRCGSNLKCKLNFDAIEIRSRGSFYAPIERLDQGHLYPLGERHAGQTMVTGGARTSAPLYLKSYLDSLCISWLFGTSTWPEAGAAFGPLHSEHLVHK
jgi:hypothetical protein